MFEGSDEEDEEGMDGAVDVPLGETPPFDPRVVSLDGRFVAVVDATGLGDRCVWEADLADPQPAAIGAAVAARTNPTGSPLFQNALSSRAIHRVPYTVSPTNGERAIPRRPTIGTNSIPFRFSSRILPTAANSLDYRSRTARHEEVRRRQPRICVLSNVR